MADHLPAAPESRQIRVFLSSTFRDYMEECDLLVKQVFSALRSSSADGAGGAGISSDSALQNVHPMLRFSALDRSCLPYR